MYKQRVIITGCSTGFGNLIAKRFAYEGLQVLATTRHPHKIDMLLPNLHILAADVSQAEGRSQITNFIKKEWAGGFDLLINNAGYGLAGPFEFTTEEQIRDQFEVNFFGHLLLTKDLIPILIKTKGKIINISSVLGFNGMPLQSLYVASKFALEGWSESLAYELASHGVQVGLIEPAGFRTDYAKNLKWPDQEHLLSHRYEKQLQGFKDFFRRISEHGPGNDPVAVVDAVIRLARKSVIPLRTRVGMNSHLFYYLRKFMPQSVFERFLKRLYHKLLKIKDD